MCIVHVVNIEHVSRKPEKWHKNPKNKAFGVSQHLEIYCFKLKAGDI
jgi:hypothetical protein